MKTIFSVTLLLLWVEGARSQPNFFNKSYDGPNHVENGLSLLQMNDNGFLLACASYDYDNYAIPSLYIIRTDKDGDTLWTKSIMRGETGFEPRVIEWANKDQIIIGGNAICCDGICANYFLTLMDTLGDTLWTKIYKPLPYHYAVFSGLIATEDNGFLAFGDANISDTCSIFGIAYGILAQVIKVDSNGNIQWQKYYGGDSLTSTNASSVVETNSHNFIIAGSSSINDAYQITDGYLLYLDSNGNFIWQKTFGYYNILEGFNSIFKASEEGYYFLAGYNRTLDNNSHDWLIRIDSSGSEQWEKYYGEDSLLASAFVKGVIANDDNIVLAGDQFYWSGEPGRGVLMKISQEGDSIWSYSYRGDTGFYYMSQFYEFENDLYDFVETADSGLAAIGTDHPYTSDVWLLKVDQCGWQLPGCQVQSGITQVDSMNYFTIFPNPASNTTYIEINSFFQNSSLKLVNSLGQLVLEKKMDIGQSNTSIDISSFHEGIYLLILKTETTTDIKKLVVQR